MERELTDLRAQVRDISDLAREYRSQVQVLSSELSDFRRREPLVQLLWHEIVQVKCALEAAVAAGYSYDAGEPTGRYVDLAEVRGIADVNNLDVVRMLAQPGHHLESSKADHKGRRSHSRRQSRVGEDSGAANAMLDEFIPVFVPTIDAAPSPLPSAPSLASPSTLFSPASSDVPVAPSSSDIPNAPPPGAPPMGAQVVVPSKAVVHPAKKMKALHWQRFIIGEGGRKDGKPTLWSDVDAAAVSVDWEELATRFCDARASIKGGKEQKPREEAKEEAQKEVRVLSDKRFNAVSIMMTSLPPVDAVVSAIARLDSSLLSKDQVAALRRNMPDEAELAQLSSLTAAQVALLSRPDAFMRSLTKGSDAVTARLDCWHWQLNHAELLEEVSLPLKAIGAGVRAIRSGQEMKRLLKYVLEVGNYMNGGTVRGQADGFDLTVLSRLSSLRDVDNRTSLLVWLLGRAAEAQGEAALQALEEELGPVAAASDFPLKAALSACSRFTSLTRTMQRTATLVCAQSTEASDPFRSVFAAFNADAEAKAAEVSAEAQQLQMAWVELLGWMNPIEGGAVGKALMPSEELFGLLRELRDLVRDVRVERREEAEEDARLKRIEDAKRAAAAIKAKQALLGGGDERRPSQHSD